MTRQPQLANSDAKRGVKSRYHSGESAIGIGRSGQEDRFWWPISSVRWILMGGASAAVALGAWGVLLLFRYQPMAAQPYPGFLLVWDRLGRRECMTPRPETTNVTGMACRRQEIEALIARIDRAEHGTEQQASEAAAAEAYKSALATAAGDPALAKDVEVLRGGGFSDAAIKAYVAVQRVERADPAMAAKIERARAAGATDAAILTSIKSRPPRGRIVRPGG